MASITTEAAYEPRAAYSPRLNTPMKMEPSGTSPISTLSPESLPASMLPAPIPSDRHVIRSPTSRSLAFSVSLPNSTRSIWNSSARNQK